MKLRPTGFVFEVCDRARRPGQQRQDRLILEYDPALNRTDRHALGYLR